MNSYGEQEILIGRRVAKFLECVATSFLRMTMCIGRDSRSWYFLKDLKTGLFSAKTGIKIEPNALIRVSKVILTLMVERGRFHATSS